MQLDSTLVAALITSIATLFAAFITVSSIKKANTNLEDGDKYSVFNKTYTILLRKSDNSTLIIKDGFSWMAVFFHVFWLFYSKLWEVVFVIILIVGGIYLHLYITDYIGGSYFLSYYVSFLNSIKGYTLIFLGMFGNRLLMRKYTHSFCLLEDRNYVPVDSVVATTKTNALLKYMEKQNNG